MTFQTASAGNLCLVQMYTIYSLYWSSQLYSLIFEKKKKKEFSEVFLELFHYHPLLLFMYPALINSSVSFVHCIMEELCSSTLKVFSQHTNCSEYIFTSPVWTHYILKTCLEWVRSLDLGHSAVSTYSLFSVFFKFPTANSR